MIKNSITNEQLALLSIYGNAEATNELFFRLKPLIKIYQNKLTYNQIIAQDDYYFDNAFSRAFRIALYNYDFGNYKFVTYFSRVFSREIVNMFTIKKDMLDIVGALACLNRSFFEIDDNVEDEDVITGDEFGLLTYNKTEIDKAVLEVFRSTEAKKVFDLYFEGYSYVDIAKKLGIHHRKVRSYVTNRDFWKRMKNVLVK